LTAVKFGSLAPNCELNTSDCEPTPAVWKKDRLLRDFLARCGQGFGQKLGYADGQLYSRSGHVILGWRYGD
jgi:hypothetical protein